MIKFDFNEQQNAIQYVFLKQPNTNLEMQFRETNGKIVRPEQLIRPMYNINRI